MRPPTSRFELVLTSGPAPHQFTAFVTDGDAGRAAEHIFDWRTDSTALAMDLGALARAAASGEPPDDDLHLTFGRHLFDTAFAGAVGDLWRARPDELGPRREPLRLMLRIDPKEARPLLNLPWEYLHDGHDFLSLNWRTPAARLPWGLPAASLPPLDEPLRLLVCLAAPLGLNQNMVLNTAREEDIILSALAPARRGGRIEIEFTPNGSPEALETALRDYDPHLLHFTGHGVFDRARDGGYLLMESPEGRERRFPNPEFAELIERRARSLRLVFLSACQSAVAPQQEGYTDLAPRLLKAGIPAAVAMQFSVLNRSAMDFGGVFYQRLAEGDPIDTAMTEARGALARGSLNRVDFAAPVLFLSDPDCLRVDKARAEHPERSEAQSKGEARRETPLDLTGAARAQNFVGRSAELRELQTHLDPLRQAQGAQVWRAAIVYGLGGMGKTVLAARLAERLAGRLDGVKAIRLTPTTTARELLDQISAYLLVHNTHFQSPLIAELARVKDEPHPLETKAAALVAVLRAHRLLLIFDNYEDVLPDGRAVSRSAPPSPELVEGVSENSLKARVPAGVANREDAVGEHLPPSPEPVEGGEGDPDLPKLVRLLIENVPGPSRFLFTSRVDFNPVEVGRLTDAIGHLPLGEMQFRDAVYVMETLDPLNRLPVAVIPDPSTAPLRGSAQDAPPSTGSGGGALAMRDVYLRLGGHPYTLNLFAEHARRSSVDAVLKDLTDVKKELLDFTLLDRAVAELPERAAQLLRRAAIYDEPVPVEGLAFLLGDEHDAMPTVDDEVQALLSWGLLARPPGTDEYALHALVRDWGRERQTPDEQLALLRRAAQFWQTTGRESTSLEPWLIAHHYLLAAGDYEAADDIVQLAFEYLLRWGQMELLLRLLNDSVRTLQGKGRAAALGNRATVYMQLGDYTTARKHYEEALAEFERAGNPAQVAAVLHHLGILNQNQGEYARARERYEQSLMLFQELGDRAAVARSLHQLGRLDQAQGNYVRARERYKQSLMLFQELGDRTGVANSLHELGNLHYRQGEYARAREHYEQSLAMLQELGDRAGVANSLHQLGVLHQNQGEYVRARERYEQSLAMLQELGDRAGVASSLGQLGILHRDQGEYARARERYEQSLAIKQELGDRAGVARSLGQLGLLLEEEGRLTEAVAPLARAFAIFEQLGAPQRELARQALTSLREKLGAEAFEQALQAAGVSVALDTDESAQEGGMTIEQLVEVAVNNTVAVLTQAQDQKAEWWEALGKLQAQARQQNMSELAQFLGAARQLIEGADPAHLGAGIPAEFQAAWESIVRGVSGSTDGTD